MSVAEAVTSQIPIVLPEIGLALQHSLRFSDSELQKSQHIAAEIITLYSGKVRAKIESSDSIVFSELPTIEQESLEKSFDAAIIREFGIERAERVKFQFIRFFYFHTGAFGKFKMKINVQGRHFVVSLPDLDPVKIPRNHYRSENTEFSNWLKTLPIEK